MKMKQEMYRALYATGLLVLLVLAHMGPSMAQEPDGPRILVEETFFDAKNVKEGDIVEHTFKVLNPGDKTLTITRVNPG